MSLTMRPYGTNADYWSIRAFLRETFALNHRRQLSWFLARFEHWYWPGVNIYEQDWCRLEETVFLWEDEDGRLVAMLSPESQGEVYLNIHPDHRTPTLEAEMIATAEKHLAVPHAKGGQQVRIWTMESDDLRQELLTSLGYTRSEGPEYQRRRSMDQPIPDASLPPGYTVRALRAPDDLSARNVAGWKAFQGEDCEVNPRYATGDWFKTQLRIPIYRRDMDLVVTDPYGEIAAFCTVWYDDVSRTGYFEPVGTVPRYQRKGLGRAVMTEGLRRLKAAGGDLALVSSYSNEAGGLYASVGFTEYDLLEPWVKIF